MNRRHSILVAGVGNTLLSDEGVGVHAARRLMERAWPPEVEVIDAATGGFTLLGHIEDVAHVILIDACDLKEPPGTVRVLTLDAVRSTAEDSRISLHSVQLPDFLALLESVGYSTPLQTHIVAVQPHTIAWSDELSPPVAAALERIVDTVTDVVEQCLRDLAASRPDRR